MTDNIFGDVSEEEKQINDLAFDLLGLGYYELKILNIYCRCGEKFDSSFIQNIIDTYKELPSEDYQDFVIKEMNGLMWCAISGLFELICDNVLLEDESLRKEIELLGEEFEPYIENTNSGFNNTFDNLDLTKSDKEIVNQAIELIKEEKLAREESEKENE